MTIFLDEAEHETEQDIVEKTAESRQIYDERMTTLIKSAEIDHVPDKARRERIKKLLDYSISGIIREKTNEGANSEAMYREIKAYIELVKAMSVNLPEPEKEEPIFMA